MNPRICVSVTHLNRVSVMTAEKKVNNRRAVVGPVRTSYNVLAIAKQDDHGTMKFSLQGLVPKTDKALVTKLRRLIYNAILACPAANGNEAKAKTLLTGSNPNFKLPLRDADAEDREGEEYKGMYFFNASTNDKKGRPGCVLKNGTKLNDPDEIMDELYSGCWAQVSVTAFYFDNSGNKGIAFALNNVMKWKNDTRLDGSVEAEDEFADLIDPDADDDGFGDDDIFGDDDSTPAPNNRRAPAAKGKPTRKPAPAGDFDDDDFDI